MQLSPPSPRRRRPSRAALLLRLLLVAALCLAFLTSTQERGAAPSSSSPARALLVVPRRGGLPLTTVRGRDDDGADAPPPHGLDAVLLPDWEVLLVLHPDQDYDDGDAPPAPAGNNATATCVFPGGAASPARPLGRMPTSGRRAYTCAMPEPERERRHNKKHLRAPKLVVTSEARSPPPPPQTASSRTAMHRWSGRLVYDAAAARDGSGDVLVFARGVNPRQGVNRDAADVRCVYYASIGEEEEEGVVASLPAITSAQQVFRCPRPPPTPAAGGHLRVTLAVAGDEEPIPSMATYSSSRRQPSTTETTKQQEEKKKARVCACTMVRDVGKFLREWAVYHAAVGVDRFFLYDNGGGGGDDDLGAHVQRLRRDHSVSVSVSTLAWPWPKSQEAGFSHAAAAHVESCEWMAFVDVDEFIFSPSWAGSPEPSKSMLRSLVAVGPDVGQITLGCRDFGPSGRTEHPREGVTQGYTCRRLHVERHKSLVRLGAVGRPLLNSVHHFELRAGFRWERSSRAVVNHYKYQAWAEFKAKFRRRVSTYVADWTQPVNPGSRDRTPGLGFQAVEPDGWPTRFCDVHDTSLRDATRTWFGHAFTKVPTSR
ncbi:hypothetical protein U9M48_026113 [Paspalum notatum var. saurae]|uniref:Glycosyltransferase family 92 protein n=1 Tax=Paspalum notatum var. saurae TaxID=547442 RepID=A0AAQ3TTZ4_PASNO